MASVTYEVIRTSTASGFQKCGHKHRSRKSAEKCKAALNKKSRTKDWYISQW